MLEFNGTAIVLAISFIIFVILENFLFYSPMKKTLDERENYIQGNEKEAAENLSAAQKLVDEKDEKIKSAKSKSAQLLNETSLKVQENYDSSIKKAKLNSIQKIEETKSNLELEKTQAQVALRNEIGSYASQILSKILKKEVVVVNVNDSIIENAMRGEK